MTSIFLEYNLRLIGEEHSQDAGWPGAEVIKDSVQRARGLFIWAATACRFIREGLFAEERLHTLLQGGTAPVTPEEHLNGIYMLVLQNSIHQGYSQRQLRLHHPSFRDFLLNKDRCNDPNFWVDEKQAHQMLADNCIRLMSASLHQDICRLDAPGTLVDEVESSRIEQCLPPDVQYACLYWVQHLQKGGAQLHDNHQVHQFLRTHFLHWLEALSWMRRLSEGILVIITLESIVLVSLFPTCHEYPTDLSLRCTTVPGCMRLFTT